MRLILPPLEIPAEDPFLADKLGNRRDFGERLLNLISNIEDGLVISINAPWGEGKTTFLKMWMSYLKINNTSHIYFDAFSNDYVNDPFIALSGQIAEQIKKSDPQSCENFINKAARASIKLLPVATRIGLKSLTLGAIQDTDTDNIREIIKELANDSSTFAENIVRKKLQEYDKDVDEIESFKKELEEFSTRVRKETEKPLVFIIDELDRCKPSYALEIIEKVKHFLSVKNIFFIISINRKQLENSIECIYGNKIDSHTYLQKFINIDFSLPKSTETYYENDYDKYCNFLYREHNIEVDYNISKYVSSLSRILELSLRDIEKIFSAIVIFLSFQKKTSHIGLTAFIALVKVKFPKIFNNLKNRNFTYDALISHKEIDKLFSIGSQDSYVEQIRIQLTMLLCSDEELANNDALRDSYDRHFNSFIWQTHKEREDIIPFFCKTFDFH